MKKENEKKGKYPSKGMNALAKKRPDVAKKIMGYKEGGRAKPMSAAQIKAEVMKRVIQAEQRAKKSRNPNPKTPKMMFQKNKKPTMAKRGKK